MTFDKAQNQTAWRVTTKELARAAGAIFQADDTVDLDHHVHLFKAM